MTKQNNTIFWIIGIVILVFIILPKLQVPTEEGMIGLTPHYYKDGVEVFPTRGFLGFSIVNGEIYDQISFDISATNQDVPLSNIQIVNASPIEFKNALPTTIQSLTAGQSKTLWTSDPMDTVQFESLTQPIRFFVRVSGKDTYGNTFYTQGYVDLTIGKEETEIYSWEDLANIKNNLDGTYILMVDLDSNSKGYNTYASLSANNGNGWLPIGGTSNAFNGTFDGNKHTIGNLYISRLSSSDKAIGLFGMIAQGAKIKNIGVINCNINGYWYVGGLVGQSYASIISNSYSTGNVSGRYYIGGLVGTLYSGSIINNSYSRTNLYWWVSQQGVGGLVGYDYISTIYNSYSAGPLRASTGGGGLVGIDLTGTYINSYYDMDIAQQSDTGKGEPKTTIEMKTKSTFTDAGWDFDNVWSINSLINDGYPYLM